MIQHAYKKKRKVIGLGAAMKCSFCTKEGHVERECWTKNPELKIGYRGMTKVPRVKKEDRKRQMRYYRCGKRGHIKRDCKEAIPGMQIAMMAITSEKRGKQRTHNGRFGMHGSPG